MLVTLFLYDPKPPKAYLVLGGHFSKVTLFLNMGLHMGLNMGLNMVPTYVHTCERTCARLCARLCVRACVRAGGRAGGWVGGCVDGRRMYVRAFAYVRPRFAPPVRTFAPPPYPRSDSRTPPHVQYV